MKEISHTCEIGTKRVVNYLIHLPEKYDEEKRHYPLVVFFHGGGERGDCIQDIKRYGIFQFVMELDLPLVILSMQCQANRIWDYHFSELNELILSTFNQYRIDSDKVIAVGFSLGGFAAIHYGILRPDLVKGVVSIAGGTVLRSNLRRLESTPVLLIHGEDDKRVPIGSSQIVFEQLKEYGSNVKFLRRKSAGHEICTTIFGETVIYDWLKEQNFIEDSP